MKLTPDKQQILLDRLKSLKQTIVCNVCGNAKWSASNTIFELREFSGGNLIIGNEQSLYPVIPITCNFCGNTHFLSALQLGLLEPNTEEGKNE